MALFSAGFKRLRSQIIQGCWWCKVHVEHHLLLQGLILVIWRKCELWRSSAAVFVFIIRNAAGPRIIIWKGVYYTLQVQNKRSTDKNLWNLSWCHTFTTVRILAWTRYKAYLLTDILYTFITGQVKLGKRPDIDVFSPFFPSSAVQLWWVCAQCRFRFLFLGDVIETRCDILLPISLKDHSPVCSLSSSSLCFELLDSS